MNYKRQSKKAKLCENYSSMYVCIYVYTGLYLYMCVRIYISTYVRKYVVRTNIYMCVYM